MLFKFIRLALVAFALMSAGSAMAETPVHFVSVIEDLPLMADLQEVGEGVQFSTPQGRIAEITAQGQVSHDF